jgi:putative hydroxymethylpyrimidine transport system permease protein
MTARPMRGAKVLGGLAAACLGIALWQAIIWITDPPSFILPSPLKVAETMWTLRGLIAENALITIYEIALGLAIGISFGVATAVQLAMSPTARALMRPLLVFLQSVPVFALAPLLTLWLGYGLTSKVLMAVLIIYFPVTSAFFDGLMRTPQGWLDMARIMDGSNWSIMRRIRIPAALPSLGSGLRLAAVYAPFGAVIGEWVGASKGLGYLMLYANGRAKTDLMFAAFIVLALIAVALFVAADRLAKRLGDDRA